VSFLFDGEGGKAGGWKLGELEDGGWVVCEFDADF